MRYVIRILFLFPVILFSFYVSAFTQSLTWQKLYRGIDNYDTYGADICQLNDGGFLIISNKYNPHYVFILHVNKFGGVLDSNSLSLTNCVTCVPTNDNCCMIIGYEYPPSASVFAAKINSTGQIVWKKNYDSTGATECEKIIRTTDNKYLCCGRTNYWYGFAMKIDENGNLLWKKTYPVSFIKEYKWVCESNVSGYVLAGIILDSATSPAQGIITKIDTSGNIFWERRYKEVIFTINKITTNYLLSIYYPDTISYQADHTGMIKIDESGNILTKKIYFSPGYELENQDCKVINPNKYLFLNYRQKLPNDTSSAYAFFTDSSGSVLRTYIYGGFDYSILNKAIITSDGGFAFAGSCNNITPHVNSAFIVRTDSNLYAPPVGIFGSGQQILNSYTLVNVYPNPFNSQLKISMNISKTGYYQLVLYDILGKEIQTILRETIVAGAYKKIVNMNNYPSGIYFLKFHGEKINICQKIVFIK